MNLRLASSAPMTAQDAREIWDERSVRDEDDPEVRDAERVLTAAGWE